MKSSAAASANVPPRELQNGFVWGTVAVLVVMAVVNFVIAYNGHGSSAGLGVFLVVCLVTSLALVTADWSRNQTGRPAYPSLWLGILLLPVYLFLRARRTGHGLLIPLVWCAAFLAQMFAGPLVPVTFGVPLDSMAVETEIANSLATQLGMSVVVTCPDQMRGIPGATFNCTVKLPGSDMTVIVTVSGTQGQATWAVEKSCLGESPDGCQQPVRGGSAGTRNGWP